MIAVHRHKKTSETMAILRGRLVVEYYSEAGECVESIELSPGGPVAALNIPVGQWHTLRALESGTVILEMKDGAYQPLEEDEIW